MFGSIDPFLLVASLMMASTPILLAAMGELVVEKSGVLNLGVEGMMILGAIAGFITAVEVGSPALGFVAAAVASAILALLFGFLTQVLLSNQVAQGLELGGACLSLVIVPQWTEGMTAGRGWIALAIVVFASWRAGRVLLGAYLFGGVSVLQLNLQAAGFAIPVELLSMSPYLITILVLVIMSSDRKRTAQSAPASLGRSFHASN